MCWHRRSGCAGQTLSERVDALPCTWWTCADAAWHAGAGIVPALWCVTHTPCAGAAAQVLRLTVEATGMARRLCAPREVIVERLFKRCVGQLSGGHHHVLTTVSQACRAVLLLCVRQHMLLPACRE